MVGGIKSPASSHPLPAAANFCRTASRGLRQYGEKGKKEKDKESEKQTK
jgi:hypothetical protein